MTLPVDKCIYKRFRHKAHAALFSTTYAAVDTATMHCKQTPLTTPPPPHYVAVIYSNRGAPAPEITDPAELCPERSVSCHMVDEGPSRLSSMFPCLTCPRKHHSWYLWFPRSVPIFQLVFMSNSVRLFGVERWFTVWVRRSDWLPMST